MLRQLRAFLSHNLVCKAQVDKMLLKGGWVGWGGIGDLAAKVLGLVARVAPYGRY
jgi:hypothetical protein